MYAQDKILYMYIHICVCKKMNLCVLHKVSETETSVVVGNNRIVNTSSKTGLRAQLQKFERNEVKERTVAMTM